MLSGAARQFSSTDSSPIVREFLNGASLISADHDTVIENGTCEVLAKKGAMVLLVAQGVTLSVYNFDDRKYGSVLVKVGTQTIPVATGRFVSIHREAGVPFEQLNPLASVGYANVVSSMVSKGSSVHSGEFDYFSAIRSIKGLSQLLVSKKDGQMQQASWHLAKTIVSINSMRAGKVKFEIKAAQCLTQAVNGNSGDIE
jgi:small ligand-binding sensory domain FIST